jgi:hypothetical protein
MRSADKQGPTDCRIVMDAASALGMREYDFFRLAFRQWFGREAEEKALERIFVQYMFHQEVPAWVRHLGREVLLRRDRGEIVSAQMDIGRYRPPTYRHPLGRVYVALAAAAWLVLYTMLLNTQYDPGTSAPIHCQSQSGSRFIDIWAHILAGREPPPCHAREKEPRART